MQTLRLAAVNSSILRPVCLRTSLQASKFCAPVISPRVSLVRNVSGPFSTNDRHNFLFTSESVNEGHADKMCDQISDAVLDAHLEQDPYAKVACETATKTGMVLLLGEITSSAQVDFQNVVRETIKDIGYNDSSTGFDYETCSVLLAIQKQLQEIADSVHIGKKDEDLGAGDQGLMFGYATDETEELMPLTTVLSHKLCARMSECRKNNILPWLLPDGKTQVTVEYNLEDGACVPKRVHTILISTHHRPGIHVDEIRHHLLETIIKPVIPEKYLDDKTVLHLLPSGSFEIGGPLSDAGLTGRKIIVDTYGGWGAHGGGAFSGKDVTKVDRSGAYAARWVAKSLVAAGLCRRVLVQVAYCIGHAEPLSVSVFSYGSSECSDEELLKIVLDNFDLRPGMIIKELDLRRPIYRATSVFGHFKPGFPWEETKTLKLN